MSAPIITEGEAAPAVSYSDRLRTHNCLDCEHLPYVYSFRAESQADFVALLNRLHSKSIQWWPHLCKVNGNAIQLGSHLTFRELQKIIAKIPDGHVMAETLRRVPLWANSLARRHYAEDLFVPETFAEIQRERKRDLRFSLSHLGYSVGEARRTREKAKLALDAAIGSGLSARKIKNREMALAKAETELADAQREVADAKALLDDERFMSPAIDA